MNARRLILAVVALLGCLASIIAAAPSAGPGMTVTYTSAIKDTDVYIESARLPNGRDFPHGGAIGGKSRPNENPFNGGATMGAAPDGRQLPEYIDLEWKETPDPPPLEPKDPQANEKYWEHRLAYLRALPLKRQRVLVRSRIPEYVVNEIIEANRHRVKGHGTGKSLSIHFIWTDTGVKLHWQIWHTPAFNGQYYSDEGGDEIVPSGTTMIALYSNTIEGDRFTVSPGSPGNPARRHPASASGLVFSGSPSFAYTKHPISGGGMYAAFENEPQLPERVDFKWRLFPISIPRKPGESDAEYDPRVDAILRALSVISQQVVVRSRIPQEVQDEIAAAARNAKPHTVADSVIFIYFIWTDSGIKLHWRLKRSLPDGTLINVREGGDELTVAVPEPARSVPATPAG